MVFAEKRRADGITAPRMQIRHAGYAQYVWQLGGGFELSDGVAFNPGFRISDDMNMMGILIIAHVYAFFKNGQMAKRVQTDKTKKMSGLKIYRLPSDFFRRPLSD